MVGKERIDGWWNQFPPWDSESERWSSEQKQKQQPEQQQQQRQRLSNK
jgi:hypothetical protein